MSTELDRSHQTANQALMYLKTAMKLKCPNCTHRVLITDCLTAD